MNKILAIAWSVLLVLFWAVFGPIAVALPIVVLSRIGPSAKIPITGNGVVGLVLATIVIASMVYAVLHNSLFFEDFMDKTVEWRLLGTLGSRQLEASDTGTLYILFMENSACMLLAFLLFIFSCHSGSFEKWFRASLRGNITAIRKSRVGVFALALIAFASTTLLFHLGFRSEIRQAFTAVIFPALSILQLLSGSLLIFIMLERDRN